MHIAQMVGLCRKSIYNIIDRHEHKPHQNPLPPYKGTTNKYDYKFEEPTAEGKFYAEYVKKNI